MNAKLNMIKTTNSCVKTRCANSVFGRSTAPRLWNIRKATERILSVKFMQYTEKSAAWQLAQTTDCTKAISVWNEIFQQVRKKVTRKVAFLRNEINSKGSQSIINDILKNIVGSKYITFHLQRRHWGSRRKAKFFTNLNAGGEGAYQTTLVLKPQISHHYFVPWWKRWRLKDEFLFDTKILLRWGVT